MNTLSICAGYSGIELGVEKIIPDLNVVCYCEIEAFACCNLISKMEKGFLNPAPIWTDLKNFPTKKEFKEATGEDGFDLLTGGFP